MKENNEKIWRGGKENDQCVHVELTFHNSFAGLYKQLGKQIFPFENLWKNHVANESNDNLPSQSCELAKLQRNEN